MKKHQDGRKIINWHKPLHVDALKRRYVRNRVEDFETTITSWENDEEFYDRTIHSYDDYWDSYNAGDEYDHLLAEAMHLIRPWWPPPARLVPALSVDSAPAADSSQSTAPSLPAESSIDLASRLAAHLSLVRRDRNVAMWPTPAFVSVYEGACFSGRQQLERIWHALSPSTGGVETTLGLAFAFAPFWIRHPQHWAPTTLNRDELLISFVNHLFVRYPVPQFLYSNWLRDAETARVNARVKWLCWFILFGQGGSLYKAAKSLGWNVPKTLTQFLFEVPEGLGPTEGCMYAEIARLGGNDTEFRRLSENYAFVIDPTCRNEDGEHLKFWGETVTWLAVIGRLKTGHGWALQNRPVTVR